MTNDSSVAPEWDPRKEQNLTGKPLVRSERPGDDGVAEIVFEADATKTCPFHALTQGHHGAPV